MLRWRWAARVAFAALSDRRLMNNYMNRHGGDLRILEYALKYNRDWIWQCQITRILNAQARLGRENVEHVQA